MPDKVHKYTLHVFVGGEALSDREQDKLCEQIEAVSDRHVQVGVVDHEEVDAEGYELLHLVKKEQDGG